MGCKNSFAIHLLPTLDLKGVDGVGRKSDHATFKHAVQEAPLYGGDGVGHIVISPYNLRQPSTFWRMFYCCEY
jgi:hypothetical protein